MVASFWSSEGWIASDKVTVSGGTGTANLTINLNAAPAPGSGYIWKTAIRPVGADWHQDIANDQVNNVTVTHSQLIADGTYTINCAANGKNLGATGWANWEAVDVTPGNYDDQRWGRNAPEQ